MPCAVAAALVIAQDPDRLEADLLVGRDRTGVGRGRVDREAVVAALGDEPVDRRPERLGAEAAVLMGGREDDVEARELVLRLALLADAEPARDRAFYLDHERAAVEEDVVPVRTGPPPLARGDDRRERAEVGLGGLAEGEALAFKAWQAVRHGSLR